MLSAFCVRCIRDKHYIEQFSPLCFLLATLMLCCHMVRHFATQAICSHTNVCYSTGNNSQCKNQSAINVLGL